METKSAEEIPGDVDMEEEKVMIQMKKKISLKKSRTQMTQIGRRHYLMKNNLNI